jgi:hypothetical protein
VTPQRDAYGPDADVLAAELAEGLLILEERDPATLSKAEWDKAIAAHERLMVLGMLARRGRL